MTEDREQRTDGEMEKPIRTINDLKVYKLAYDLAMQIFEVSKEYPREEKYSLTDQIRRSSRSVAINIREGFAKRRYEQILIRHFNDSLGSSEETRGWLSFSKDCGYLSEEKCLLLDGKYDEVNAMLYSLMNNWQNI